MSRIPWTRTVWNRLHRSKHWNENRRGVAFLVAASSAAAFLCRNESGSNKNQLSNRTGLLMQHSITRCDTIESEIEFPSGYTEADRFFDCLEYHRSLLPDYARRWIPEENETSLSWPHDIPQRSEIPALEMDLKFCRRNGQKDRICQDLEFRIATYYVTNTGDFKSQRKGFKMIKTLAEQGHPDGMCLYGMILNQGYIPGVDANPQLAVVWWRRCVDDHLHITAIYELGVALYTGEGVAENPSLAVRYFRRAANLGHPGAAYMLGECLLDGVGTKRDRADALEWLVTAAELGHSLARKRVMFVLTQEYEQLDAGETGEDEKEETLKWGHEQSQAVRTVNIERRYTIGGGSRNPEVLASRKTKVSESREDTNPLPR